jgi:hypothetical protein
VIDCLGNPQPFFPQGSAIGERPQLGMAPGEPATGGHGGQEELGKTLMTRRTLKGRHGLPEAV